MTIKKYGGVGLWGGGVKSAVTLLMITPPNSVVCVRDWGDPLSPDPLS